MRVVGTNNVREKKDTAQFCGIVGLMFDEREKLEGGKTQKSNMRAKREVGLLTFLYYSY
jgi:hypothetical protein